MKKAYSAVLSILLCFVFSFGAFAESKSTELRTVVPSTHEITITYNEGGRIVYDGEVIPSGTVITAERFDDLSLAVLLDSDSHLKIVTADGEDITDEVIYGKLDISKVHTDMEITFTFEKCLDDLPDGEPDPDEKCSHINMSGGVFKGENPMPGAKLDIDFGEIVVSADENGEYKIDDIKDGYHIVRVLNEDGTPAGNSDFAINISSEATEVTVEILPDGMRLVTVPKGDGSVMLDFIVSDDGTSGSGGTGDVDIVPSKPKTPTVPDDNGHSNPITDNPIIAVTGALMRENPILTGALLVISFFVFILLFLRRRREDEEEEQAQ